MKTISAVLGTVLTVLSLYTTARAQSNFWSGNSLSLTGSITGGAPVCDTNDRTADEVRQCKLDYWRKEIEESRKRFDKAQTDLNHAQDRARAFEKQ